MIWEQRGVFILNEAYQLGFKQEDCIEQIPMDWMKEYSIYEQYLHLFEKMIDFAESYICKNQVPEFTKEIYHDLHYIGAFSFELSNGGWVDVDMPGGFIDWNKHKDCKDTDKIFFYSHLDSDNKTVLKFYDLGSKKHLI